MGGHLENQRVCRISGSYKDVGEDSRGFLRVRVYNGHGPVYCVIPIRGGSGNPRLGVDRAEYIGRGGVTLEKDSFFQAMVHAVETNFGSLIAKLVLNIPGGRVSIIPSDFRGVPLSAEVRPFGPDDTLLDIAEGIFVPRSSRSKTANVPVRISSLAVPWLEGYVGFLRVSQQDKQPTPLRGISSRVPFFADADTIYFDRKYVPPAAAIDVKSNGEYNWLINNDDGVRDSLSRVEALVASKWADYYSHFRTVSVFEAINTPLPKWFMGISAGVGSYWTGSFREPSQKDVLKKRVGRELVRICLSKNC